MRIRVLAGIGIAAALVGLTGCRSSPDVAAYVDDRTISEDRVSELVDGFMTRARSQATAQGQDQAKIEKPARAIVVGFLVREQICERARNKLKFAVEEPSLPSDLSELEVIAARTQACEQALPGSGPVKPTDADARQIFEAGVAHGIWEPNSAPQQIPGLMANEDVAAALSRKKTLTEALAGVDITINPKYGVIAVPLISFRGGAPAVSVMFGEAGPVSNRPVPASLPAQPQ